jgi:UPF0755 protein
LYRHCRGGRCDRGRRVVGRTDSDRGRAVGVTRDRLSGGVQRPADGGPDCYGLGLQGTKPLTKADLRSASPYNTRRFKGLPPTPIGNPGLASMRAAAHPAAVDYLYYVRKPDRHHFFTADERELCRKAKKYGYRC